MILYVENPKHNHKKNYWTNSVKWQGTKCIKICAPSFQTLLQSSTDCWHIGIKADTQINRTEDRAQKETHTSTVRYFMTKEPRICKGERTVPLLSGAGKTEQTHAKEWIRTTILHSTQTLTQNEFKTWNLTTLSRKHRDKAALRTTQAWFFFFFFGSCSKSQGSKSKSK